MKKVINTSDGKKLVDSDTGKLAGSLPNPAQVPTPASIQVGSKPVDAVGKADNVALAYGRFNSLKDAVKDPFPDWTFTDEENKDMRPVWLLDVDGVLNSLSSAPNPKELRRGEATQKYVKTDSGPTFRIRIHNDLVDFINKMNDSGLVNLRWATTWSDQANTRLAVEFGLPQLPIGARPGEETGRFSDYNWKSNAARRVLRSGRKLIWTDDEAIPEGFEDEIADISKGHLIIRPNDQIGLTLEDCKKIEEFIQNA